MTICCSSNIDYVIFFAFCEFHYLFKHKHLSFENLRHENIGKHNMARIWRIQHRCGVFRFLVVADDHHHRHIFWHQPASCRCKGIAPGFGNVLLLLSVLLKNISNAFKNYLDFFIKNQRLLFHDWYSPCFSFLPPKETLASPL